MGRQCSIYMKLSCSIATHKKEGEISECLFVFQLPVAGIPVTGGGGGLPQLSPDPKLHRHPHRSRVGHQERGREMDRQIGGHRQTDRDRERESQTEEARDKEKEKERETEKERQRKKYTYKTFNLSYCRRLAVNTTIM